MLLAAVFFAGLCLVSSYLESDHSMNIEIRHALFPKDVNEFTFRSNISLPNFGVGMTGAIKSSLTPIQQKAIENLANLDQFYRVKSIALYPDGKKYEFFSSMKASTLTNMRLNDVIWVSIDTTGSICAVTQTFNDYNQLQTIGNIPIDLDSFNTNMIIQQMNLAPVPDTTSFIQKLEREREARERGEVKDNRGFFAKYWMYIVPIGLLVLISGVTNPESSQGNGR